jgi:transketolase
VGTLVARCLQAAERLASTGIEAAVIDMHTIKPLDAAAVLRAARDTGAIVTEEEHTIVGGLGAAVAETLSGAVVDAPVVRVGLADRFVDSGRYEELLDVFGMSVDDLAAAARHALSLRDQRTARTTHARRGEI